MPRIFLYGADGKNPIFLNADDPAPDKPLTLRSLQLPNSALFSFSNPVAIPGSFTAPVTPGGADLKLTAGDGTGFALTVQYVIAAAGNPFNWFGVTFQANADLSAELAIQIPANGAAPGLDQPFAAIRVCGAFQISAAAPPASAVFTSSTFCCQVEIPALPEVPASAPTPGFRLRLPSLGIDFPRLALPWSFPDFPNWPFRLPGFTGGLGALPISISYDSVNADVQPGVITIDIHHLRIAGKLGAIDGDLHAVLKNGTIDLPSCSFILYQPDFSHTVSIPISLWHIAPGCLTLGWTEGRLRDLLGLVLPDFASEALPSSGVKLRILMAGAEFREVRLDWDMAGQPLPFPGFKVALPAGSYSIIGSLQDQRLLVAATVAKDAKISADSDFTWSRGGPRELLRDDGQAATAKPFLHFGVTAQNAATVTLLDLPLGGSGGPKVFQQLSAPLTPLGTDCTPTNCQAKSLDKNTWGAVEFAINLDTDFKFPFLRLGDSQFITIGQPPLPQLVLGDHPVVDVKFPVTVKLGDTLKLTTEITLEFQLESFAFAVKEAGIPFTLKTAGNGDLFGLHWEVFDEQGKPDFEVFRLVTKGGNYQLKQGSTAVLQLSFTKATSEGSPIIFTVRNFALGPKGVDLDAAVAPRPAKLAGIDTEFTFRQGSFQIREGRLVDFAISGSGPLPPALVGSATADIAMQFHQNDAGDLELVSGAAKLAGKNLLKCQGTRFQFSVDALGLQFVKDSGRYHLYFTVTGMAKFVPLDGDDSSGPLAWLPKIEMHLMECPLTGDARVISKHVEFLVEMPRKASFALLGCFSMEVRSIGFVPQAPMFDDSTSAMRIAGQIKFAESGGDAIDARIDFHDLYLGLPAPGSLLPRIYCQELGVKLKVGSAFELNGTVDFLDNKEIQPGVRASGFRGDGSLSIQGLPTMAASIAFLRVSDDNGVTWNRAWFIYLEVDKVSFEIPVVEVFIREVGLGFGYRYTLAMIKAADDIQDPRELLKKLKELSLSQGDLSHFDQWRVDSGGAGDPRFTIVLRALIAQSSATEVPTEWLEDEEEELPCLFLLDVVLALRSDFTFLMTARGWLNTNYWDYVNDTNGVRRAPLVTGFVLLSPRQKRFLAHVGSNPGAQFGDHPPLPSFLKDAIRSSYFTATLLVEPGLIHYELGWPNMLGWNANIGPLAAEFRGGSIFRVSRTEIVTGTSYQARGSLDIEAGVDLGFIGARLTAHASVAYGARYIGVLGLTDTINRSAFYAVEGIDIRVTVSVSFWIKIDLGFFGSIQLNFGFSFGIAITASVQVGILLRSPFAGIRGSATVALNIMGHGLHFGISIAGFPEVVDTARQITEQYLSMGLEATDVQPIPGEPPKLGDASTGSSKAPTTFSQATPPAAATAVPTAVIAAPAPAASPTAPVALAPAPAGSAPADPAPAGPAPPAPVAAAPVFITPNYTIYSVPPTGGDTHYFLLMPSATRFKEDDIRLGFFAPPPPNGAAAPPEDYTWTLSPAVPILQHYNPKTNKFEGVPDTRLTWACDWDAVLAVLTLTSPKDDATTEVSQTVRNTLCYAYTLKPPSGNTGLGALDPVGDPIWLNPSTTKSDSRVDNPADSAYEAAVRGAAEQVTSPKFKSDPHSPFDQDVSAACSFGTTIYQTDAQDPGTEYSVGQAVQMRSTILYQMIQDVGKYAVKQDSIDVMTSLAFRLGMVFSVPAGKEPVWLVDGSSAGTLSQRTTLASQHPDSGKPGEIRAFNLPQHRFDNPLRPPRFDRVRQFADANTIAIAWDLTWNIGQTGPTPDAPQQDDPEHHLAYYAVRRRPLDGSDRGIEYTVRPADVLHLPDEKTPALTRLRPRFHVVDHFNSETLEDQAALPAQGKSYLYTVTPVDIAGFASPRPLTLVATRFPDQPPLVPADAELMVTYVMDQIPGSAGTAIVTRPSLDQAEVSWTPPVQPPNTPRVPAQAYRLLFRREQAMPIGSYGLDSSAQGSQAKGLPVSNARPLRTDIKVDLTRSTGTFTDGKEHYLFLFSDLQTKGILPVDNGPWRPDSWRVFLQAQSTSEVWSGLAPVQFALKFARQTIDPKDTVNRDPIIRRPSLLEWIAQPIQFPPLPPEDGAARAGFVEVPMPHNPPSASADGDLGYLKYIIPPNRPRTIELLWNQGPSDGKVPPDLYAGYNVYEFDLDANTPQELTEANLRLIQEIELLPSGDVALTPHDTLHPEAWEAWYPATVERIGLAGARDLRVPLSNWYSWRESMVLWPPVYDMFARKGKLPRMHPILQSITDLLRGTWNSLTSYNAGDIVSYNGKSYVALQSNTPNVPGITPLFCTLMSLSGVWDRVAKYSIGDIVSYNGSSYVALKAGANNMPSAAPLFWTMIDAWNSSANYNVGSIVSYNGSSYVALQASKNDIPTATPLSWAGMGAWNSLTNYSAGEIVSYNKSSYVALQAATNKIPGATPLFWTMISQRGTWNSLANYSAGDIVSCNGSNYVALQSYAINIPGTAPSWVSINLCGGWGNLTNYNAGDIVSYNGKSYASLQPGTNNTPDSTPLFWVLTRAGQDQFVVDIAPMPPAQLATLGDFLLDTPPGTDPYGWSVLQRLGLSVCFTLRDRTTGEAKPGSVALKLVGQALDRLVAYTDLLPHVHVEHLFQPAQGIRISPAVDPLPGDQDPTNTAVSADGLLSALQISVRPIARRIYRYQPVDVKATPSSTAKLLVTVQDNLPLTVLEFSASYSASDNPKQTGQWNFAQTASFSLPMPPSGKATLLLRAERFASQVISSTDPAVTITPGAELDFSDQRTAYFTADVNAWATKFSTATEPAATQWNLFGQCATMVGATLPEKLSDQLSLVADFLLWSSRFLDLAPREPAVGPWMATAYPRLVSPLAVTPDASGRISFNHLISDAYAHNYRYYVRPSGRYDQLWQAVAQSRLFRKEDGTADELELTLSPKPNKGGLDVVLDRIQGVTAPLVLSSRRIDPIATLADPQPPGSIWEVIVAKHPEQALVERNWTLARQLSYRQIAYALLRTFSFKIPQTAFQAWLNPDPKNPKYDFKIDYVEAGPSGPLLPGPYPAPEKERLDFAKEEDIRAIDLPRRLGAFSQGALVLQWRALPYFYKQRLLVAAQAGRAVSRATEIVQCDYEYRSPQPYAAVDAMDNKDAVGRSRILEIELANYWKCLPDAAQAQWTIELPASEKPLSPLLRKYSSLPETAVIYQLILNRDAGLSETIAELYFNGSGYDKRQFHPAPDLQVTVNGVDIPAAATDRHATMFLQTHVSSNEVTRAAQNRNLLDSIPDFAAIADKPDSTSPAEQIDHFLNRWYPSRAVSGTATISPGSLLDGVVEFREGDRLVLEWDGSNPAGLEEWALKVDDKLADAIRSLAQAPHIVAVKKFLSPMDLPMPLRRRIQILPDQCVWTGEITDALLAQLTTTVTGLPDRSPAKTALAAIQAAVTSTQMPAAHDFFPKPAPARADIVALLGNPMNGLSIDVKADGSWGLFWQGINLGEPAASLLNKVVRAIPDPTDSRRKAFAAIIHAIQEFTFASNIPGVPPALAEHVLAGSYLLHLRSSTVNPNAPMDPNAPMPAIPDFFPQPAPVQADLVTSLSNPMNGLVIETKPDGTWGLYWRGSNLGEPPEALLKKVVAAIPDPTESRRKAFEAIIRAVTQDPLQLALEQLYPDSALDKASVDRLIGDLGLQKTFSQALVDWTSQEGVTSRKSFPQPNPLPERLEFPVPEVCMLSVPEKVTAEQASELLAVDADVSFKQALRQIAAGRLSAQSSIGIEQIQQIAPDTELPTLTNGQLLTWHGPLRLEQARALARWEEVSPFGGTFGALLAALRAKPFQQTFTVTDETPHPEELPPSIRDRLQIGAGALSWTGLNLDRDEELALGRLAASLNYGPTFSVAVTSLLDALLSAAVGVNVSETDWKPRKRPGELLPGTLLIGEALARFYGLMTRAECASLQTGLSAPDRAAVARLFADTTHAGLGGAAMVVRARLGSAVNRQCELDSTVA